MFEKHYEGCKKAGLKIGVYHYSYVTSPENAEKEAFNCLEHIKGKTFDLPVYYDLEEKRTRELGNILVNECVLRFKRILNQAGFKVGVYANLDWFKNVINVNILKQENISIWLAQWNKEMTANFDVDLWQYSNSDLGYDSNILINEKILTVDNVDKPVENLKEIAVDVILGKYGNGKDRKKALGKNYSYVQDIVNSLVKILK